MTGRIIAIGIALCVLPLSMASADDILATEPIVVPMEHPTIEFANTGLCVELALADHFAPDVAAGPGMIRIAPIDPDRTKLFKIPPPGENEAWVIEPPPEPPPCSPLRPCPE